MSLDYLESFRKIGLHETTTATIFFINLIAPGYLGILYYSPEFFKDFSTLNIILLSTSLSAPLILSASLPYFFSAFETTSEYIKAAKEELEIISSLINETKKITDKNELEDKLQIIENKRSELESIINSAKGPLTAVFFRAGGISCGIFYPMLLLAYTFSLPLKSFIWIVIILTALVIIIDLTKSKKK